MPRNVHPTPFVIRPSDEFAKNIDLRNLSRQLATKYADGHVVTDDDLQIMGGKTVKGDARRAVSLMANAAMQLDPVLGNTGLSDLAGGSSVFYDSMVKIEKA
jgi:hypothetical protein